MTRDTRTDGLLKSSATRDTRTDGLLKSSVTCDTRTDGLLKSSVTCDTRTDGRPEKHGSFYNIDYAQLYVAFNYCNICEWAQNAFEICATDVTLYIL